MLPALNEIGKAGCGNRSDRQRRAPLAVVLTQPRMFHARPCTAPRPGKQNNVQVLQNQFTIFIPLTNHKLSLTKSTCSRTMLPCFESCSIHSKLHKSIGICAVDYELSFSPLIPLSALTLSSGSKKSIQPVESWLVSI